MQTKTICAIIPFATAAIALCVALASRSPVIAAICFAILIFDVPVCLFVAWEWVRTGKPPDFDFFNRSERRLRAEFKTRQKLSDDAFYTTYYADSSISQSDIAKLRRILTAELFIDLSALHPHDDIAPLTYHLDTAPLVRRIEREFFVQFTVEQIETCPTTFDALARLIHSIAKTQVLVG